MKRKLMFVFAVLVLIALTACGNSDKKEKSSGGDDGPVEVKFWHAMNGPLDDALNVIVDRFNDEHDDITVKPVGQGSYDDLEQKVMASAKAKTLPTIAQAVPQMIPEYIDNNFITTLNEFMDDPDIGLSEDELDDYVEIFRESSQWDGDYYSMPFSKSTRLMFYNEDILDEYNLDPPETWDDVRTISETVTSDGVIGMGFENSFESEFQGILRQMGGEYIDEEANKATFASEEGIEAMTFIYDMIEEGIARTAGEDDYMSGPFARGDAALYIGSSPGLPHVEEAAEGNINWNTTTIPSYDGVDATTFLGNDLVMFDHASDAEKEAAWEFLAYLTSPDVTAEWAMESGYLPVRYSAQETDEFKEYLEENPVYKASVEQFDAGFFIARVKGGNAIRNVMLDELDEILLNRKTVEEGLTDAEDQANEILSKQ